MENYVFEWWHLPVGIVVYGFWCMFWSWLAADITKRS